MVIKAKIKWKISMTEIYVFILTFLSLNIDSLRYLTPFGTILNWFPKLIFLGMLILAVFRNKLTRMDILIGVFFAVFFFCTFLKNPETLGSLFTQLAPCMSIWLIIACFYSDEPYQCVKAIYALLSVLIILDIFTILLYPEGLYVTELYSSNWFLGYKSARVRSATLPVILFGACSSLMKDNKLNWKFWVIAILAWLDTYLSDNMGGLVAVTIMIVMVAALYFFKNPRARSFVFKIFNIKLILAIIVFLTITIVFIQQFDFLEVLIVNVLGRNMTLTSRLTIWTKSIQEFIQNPIFGSGYILGSDYVIMTGVRGGTQPHNMILAILVYSGIVGLIAFVTMYIYAFAGVEKNSYISITLVCAAFLISNLVFGIYSITYFAPFIYASMSMMSRASITDRSLESKNFKVRRRHTHTGVRVKSNL